jgi:hypothetical protein
MSDVFIYMYIKHIQVLFQGSVNIFVGGLLVSTQCVYELCRAVDEFRFVVYV